MKLHINSHQMLAQLLEILVGFMGFLSRQRNQAARMHYGQFHTTLSSSIMSFLSCFLEIFLLYIMLKNFIIIATSLALSSNDLACFHLRYFPIS